MNEILRLRADPASASRARHFVSASLAGLSHMAQTDTVVLLTSEVVSNVVVHTGPHGPGDEIPMTIECIDSLVRVEVYDHDDRFPVVLGAGTDATSGRGMLLLDVWPTTGVRSRRLRARWCGSR